MTCKYISCPYPSTTFVYDGCLSKLGYDGCDDKDSGDQNALIGVSTTVFGKNASCVLMPIPQGAFTEDLVALFQVFLLSSLQALLPGL